MRWVWGLYSSCGETSYRETLLRLEATNYSFIFFWSFRNFTGVSAGVLPMHLSNFIMIPPYQHSISQLRGFASSYDTIRRLTASRGEMRSMCTVYPIQYALGLLCFFTTAGTLGCVFIDNETRSSGVNKCTRGKAWSAFSWHHSNVFHCQWTHN